MKVHVIVTDNDGITFQGDATLVAVDGSKPPRGSAPAGSLGASKKKNQAPAVGVRPDFSLPVRAFVKRHTRGLRGPQKFTVLLARLADGKVGTAVALKDIEKAWNRMTGPMGGRFNPAYTTRAREQGWVDTPKTATYALLTGWAKALGE